LDGGQVCAGGRFPCNINVPYPVSSDSQIVKVTGYRLVSTVLTLGLAIAKFVLSAVNKSAASNDLDFAGFLVGGVLFVS